MKQNLIAKTRVLIRILIKFLTWFFVALGINFVVLIILSFTTLPFHIYHWLGISQAGIVRNPQYIVVLGGGSMPSESALIRTYFGAKVYAKYPEAKVIIALPGDSTDKNCSTYQMAQEIQWRGVPVEKILLELDGVNTRMQAMMIAQKFAIDKENDEICLITSPEHTRRSVLTFKKLGFKKVNANPTFEYHIDYETNYQQEQLGGKQLILPDVGNNTAFRYQFWNHLNYEIIIMREFTALAYYWLKDWI